MKTESTPQTKQDEKKPEPVEKSILAWHSEKKTKRDLLAIATTLRGWDPEQTPGAMDETIVTEAAARSAS